MRTVERRLFRVKIGAALAWREVRTFKNAAAEDHCRDDNSNAYFDSNWHRHSYILVNPPAVPVRIEQVLLFRRYSEHTSLTIGERLPTCHSERSEESTAYIEACTLIRMSLL